MALLFGFASFIYFQLCVHVFILGCSFGFCFSFKKTLHFLYKTSKKQVLIIFYVLQLRMATGSKRPCVIRSVISYYVMEAEVSPQVFWPDFRVELQQSFISWDPLPRLCNITTKTKQTCCSTTSILFLWYPNQVISI